MRYSLGDLNPKRDPSPEQKRNDHLGDSGIALSANGDEDGRSAVSRASTANTEVSFWAVRYCWGLFTSVILYSGSRPSTFAGPSAIRIVLTLYFRVRDRQLSENPSMDAFI